MDIDKFTEELLEISPGYNMVNPFNKTLQMPVVGSRAIASSANSSTDLTNDLRKAAVEFAQTYKDDSTKNNKLEALSDKIEGLLMMEETLSVLSSQKVEQLINTLYELVEVKRGIEHN